MDCIRSEEGFYFGMSPLKQKQYSKYNEKLPFSPHSSTVWGNQQKTGAGEDFGQPNETSLGIIKNCKENINPERLP